MKKQIFSFLTIAAGSFLFVACSDSKATYVDLETGKSIEVKKDDATGKMVNAETGDPVTFYVDTRSNDTLYGANGKVVNGEIVRTSEGKYILSGDLKIKSDEDEYKIKGDDYKMKVEKDGDIKIKDGDTKTKIDEDGKKVKQD